MEAMMEKPQGHTRGPWHVFDDGDGRFTIAQSRDGAWTKGVVCELDGEVSNPADRNLIAAAPDLLAALKLARAYMDVSLGSPTWNGETPYPVIDAAIAKAEGR